MKPKDDKLNELRKAIDELDSQLVPLLEQRFLLSYRIGKSKERSIKEILDTSRESHVITSRTEQLRYTMFREELSTIYKKIMEVSREIQDTYAFSKDRFGLIGKDISYTQSPRIHKAIARYFNDKLYEYHVYDIEKHELPYILNSCAGINVTIPYKNEIKQYIDTSYTTLGVNTVVRREYDIYEGYSTDGRGFEYLLKKMDISCKDAYVFILGTGATAYLVAEVLEKQGAHVRFVTRFKEDETMYTYEEFEQCSAVDLIVNTSPVGVYPNHFKSPVSETRVASARLGCIDVIYNPKKTQFLQYAEKYKKKYSNGFPMLIAQAVYAYGYFRNVHITEQDVQNIESNLAVERIVLCGLPGVGKTTIGQLLSEKLDLEFIDLDDKITREQGKTPKEIILNHGIECFRSYEKEAVNDLCFVQNVIVSLGGGTLTIEDKCIDDFCLSSTVIYLERSIDGIMETLDIEKRPLSQTKEDMETLYNERHYQYLNVADIVISEESIEDTISKILDYLGLDLL